MLQQIQAQADCVEKELELVAGCAFRILPEQGIAFFWLENCCRADSIHVVATDVAQTCHQLRQAGMKVWMVTGDKKETAQKAAVECGLVSNNVHMLELVGRGRMDRIRNALLKFQHRGRQKFSSCSPITAMLVDGPCFSTILSNDSLADFFFHVCRLSHSVIACRFNPRQKAALVLQVRKRLLEGNETTLAIGDGSNDRNMLQVSTLSLERLM